MQAHGQTESRSVRDSYDSHVVCDAWFIHRPTLNSKIQLTLTLTFGHEDQGNILLQMADYMYMV